MCFDPRFVLSPIRLEAPYITNTPLNPHLHAYSTLSNPRYATPKFLIRFCPVNRVFNHIESVFEEVNFSADVVAGFRWSI
jgi:hypothetical protein